VPVMSRARVEILDASPVCREFGRDG